jgi:hypothetical protein
MATPSSVENTVSGAAGSASDVFEDAHARRPSRPEALHGIGDVPIEPGQALWESHLSIVKASP